MWATALQPQGRTDRRSMCELRLKTAVSEFASRGLSEVRKAAVQHLRATLAEIGLLRVYRASLASS